MGSGFFALLDDITTLLEDVAVMSKVTAKKTASILGDDLAVNAEKSSGFVSSRELPVLWAISKGSIINKLIILPVAFLLSAFLPWLVTIILILGGIYLSFEGAEKIYHLFVDDEETEEEHLIKMTEAEAIAFEKGRVKSAVVTDFILSVEIIIIALGTVIGEPILTQIVVVSIIAILATVGVYGLVALIVRMDDIGISLMKKHTNEKSLLNKIGRVLIKALPKVIKVLTVVGTIALFLVSGGIFVHNIDFFHHIIPSSIPSIIMEFFIGVIIGLISLTVFKLVMLIIKQFKKI